MAFKNMMRKAVGYTLMPLMVAACSMGVMGMKPIDDQTKTPANDTTQVDKSTAQNSIIKETFALKNLSVTYNSSGVGGVWMKGSSQSGKKNTGTNAYRTDLNFDINSAPLGAANSDLQGNDAVRFKVIKFDDPRGLSDNHRAYVEFEIAPLIKMRGRGSVTPTNSSAFTVYPTFPRNMEEVDLDSVNVNNAASTQSYGVDLLTFKGYIDNFDLQSDLKNSGFKQQSIANSLIGVSSNGLLITGMSLNRTVYENSDRDTRSNEQMVVTPKNIFDPK